MTHCINLAEQRLAVAAWKEPAAFYRAMLESGFAWHHVEDRLIKVLLSYVVGCVDHGEIPTPIRFEESIAEKAVPGAKEDFNRIFLETTVPIGTDMTDLINDVLIYSDERAERVAGEHAVAHWRAVKHVQTCLDCIACCNGDKRAARAKTQKARKLLNYADCAID